MIVNIPSNAQILFVDRMLKGDKGDDGDSPAGESVQEHEAMYDHGDLHAHSNKNVLDLLTVSGQDLAYNGVKIVDRVLQIVPSYAPVVTIAEDVVLSGVALPATRVGTTPTITAGASGNVIINFKFTASDISSGEYFCMLQLRKSTGTVWNLRSIAIPSAAITVQDVIVDTSDVPGYYYFTLTNGDLGQYNDVSANVDLAQTIITAS